jgi:hypothetical protein
MDDSWMRQKFAFNPTDLKNKLNDPLKGQQSDSFQKKNEAAIELVNQLKADPEKFKKFVLFNENAVKVIRSIEGQVAWLRDVGNYDDATKLMSEIDDIKDLVGQTNEQEFGLKPIKKFITINGKKEARQYGVGYDEYVENRVESARTPGKTNRDGLSRIVRPMGMEEIFQLFNKRLKGFKFISIICYFSQSIVKFNCWLLKTVF